LIKLRKKWTEQEAATTFQIVKRPIICEVEIGLEFERITVGRVRIYLTRRVLELENRVRKVYISSLKIRINGWLNCLSDSDIT